jgi:hypothetical protein
MKSFSNSDNWGVSQPAISPLLSQAAARGVKPAPEGFSKASPYEIAERYAAGGIVTQSALTATP